MALQPPYRVSYKSHVGGPDYQRAAQSVSPVDWAGAAARGAESAQAFRATEQDMEQSAETHAARLPGIEARSGMTKAEFKEFEALAEERIASRRMEYKALEAGNQVDLMEHGYTIAAYNELNENAEMASAKEMALQELRNKQQQQRNEAAKMAQEERALAESARWTEEGAALELALRDAVERDDKRAAVEAYARINQRFPTATAGRYVAQRKGVLYDDLRKMKVAVADDAGTEHPVSMLQYLQHESSGGESGIYSFEAEELRRRNRQVAEAELLFGPENAERCVEREQLLNSHMQDMRVAQQAVQLAGAGAEPDEELKALMTDEQLEVYNLSREYMDLAQTLQEKQDQAAEAAAEGADPFQWSFGGAPIEQKRWDWRESKQRFTKLGSKELNIWRKALEQAANNPQQHGVTNPEQAALLQKNSERAKNLGGILKDIAMPHPILRLPSRKEALPQADRSLLEKLEPLVAQYDDANYETRVQLKMQAKELITQHARSLVPGNVAIPNLKDTELQLQKQELERLRKKLQHRTGGMTPGGNATGFPGRESLDELPEP